VLACKNISQ